MINLLTFLSLTSGILWARRLDTYLEYDDNGSTHIIVENYGDSYIADEINSKQKIIGYQILTASDLSHYTLHLKRVPKLMLHTSEL